MGFSREQQPQRVDVVVVRQARNYAHMYIALQLIDRVVVSCGFTSHWTQNRSFQRRFPKPISWLSMEKTRPNTTKARIHQSREMYYNTK